MIVLHGTFIHGQFLLWAETAESNFAQSYRFAPPAPHQPVDAEQKQSSIAGGVRGPQQQPARVLPALLPYAASYSRVREALAQAGIPLVPTQRQNAQAIAWLPTCADMPLASTPIIGPSAETLSSSELSSITLCPWIVPVIRLSVQQLTEFLGHCVGQEQLAPNVLLGQDLQFWVASMRFAGRLAAKQQFLPGIRVTSHGSQASWEPVFLGEDGDALVGLAKGMPRICLACEVSAIESPETTALSAQDLLLQFIGYIVDFLVRTAIRPALDVTETARASGSTQLHARWLDALLGSSSHLEATAEEIACLSAQIAEWRRPLAIASDSPFRLCFRLEEPQGNLGYAPGDESGADTNPGANDSKPQADVNLSWYLRFLLQSLDDPSLLLPVETVLSPEFEDLQLLRGGNVTAREYLFRALGQAVRLCPDIAGSFDDELPHGLYLDTDSAYDFLAHKATILKNAGFSVQLPGWWTERKAPALSMKIRQGSGLISLDDITEFDWQVAMGDCLISEAELAALSRLKMPLVCLNGSWRELKAEQLEAILHFLRKRKSNRATGRELVRMALGDVRLPEGTTFDGVLGEGLVVDAVSRLRGKIDFEEISPHAKFAGDLRPYQTRGLSWLEFLRTIGFGACLADDMGLGKTVQTLAFVQRRWHQQKASQRRPTLLICPVSLLSNWQREAAKFTPELKVLLHHGMDRAHGAALASRAHRSAIVLTTYSLLHRDNKDLKSIEWETVILDEAQNIKNPEALQAKSAYAMQANFRVALSGTPVENNVGDLWSLMHFLNPGFLGAYSDFQQRFFIPIQVCQDQQRMQQLRQLTAPFILRRLKTDKTIVPDLPEKVERKTNCYLTKEQASIYSAFVVDATRDIDAAEGMKRKSLVLTTILRLKQICDHPALVVPDRSRVAGRSGKLKRLTELLSSVISGGERALIFTQFTSMGELIRTHLQGTLGIEVLFLHGGVERATRERMVQRFQTEENGPHVFVLSLKAGGTGLNLTRANHVFHFDRWWNPAVENQATDRAFRIGQKSNVQVHKFLCPGTLEERIDEIIESKKHLASSMVEAGEGWLTELSTAQLRDVFTLRNTVLID